MSYTAPAEGINRIKGLPFFGLGGHYTTGNIFFVDSGHVHADDTNAAEWGRSPDEPLATADFAVGRCTANNGDTIFLMPGHAETVSSAATGIVADVAGISIIGLGNGTNRPTFNFTGTAGIINLDAANILLKNIYCTGNINNLVSYITVGAANCTIEDVEMVSTNALEALNFISLETTLADHVRIRGCIFDQMSDPAGTGAAAGTGAIYCEDSEHIYIDDCKFLGFFETAFVHNKTTKCTDLWVRNCYGECGLSTAFPFVLVADVTGGVHQSFFLVPAATDITVAKIVGTIGNKFWVTRSTCFGNDSGGGQLAAFGDAEAS